VTDLRIQLFGKFTVRVAGQRISALDSGKVQELLAYLLIYRDKPHSREGLAEVLWQASSTAQAKKYLRQALWQMQLLLPKGQMERVILIEPDWVRIAPEADYWLDVGEFEAAFKQVRGVLGQELGPEAASSLQRAVGLYRGDLLEGWYADWCLYERERLQNMWLAMLDKLMSYCEARRDFEGGLSFGMQVLRKDRARERTHRELMRMAYLAGDRTGALRQYERCVRALEEELHVRPGRRTEELHRQILNDGLEPAGPRRPPAEPAPVQDVSPQLDQLRKILTRLRRHVREDLEALDRALADPK
jgi:DNA-binding SARP family transcriptional activator